MAMILVYDPTAPLGKEGIRQASHALKSLTGKVVGFIDNAKPNFDHLVDDLAELLTARYGVAKIIKRKKRAASVPATASDMKDLVEQCDLVITGSGD